MKLFFCVIGILLILCTFGYSFNPDNLSQKVYTLGIPVYSGKSLDVYAFKHLIKTIEKRFHNSIKFRIKYFTSYEKIKNLLLNDKLDFAVFPPFVFAQNMDNPKIRYLGTKFLNGKSYRYNSVCIVKKQSHIKHIRDLKFKKIGFSSKYSTSGFIIPMEFLSRKNLIVNKQKLFTPVICGSHQKVIEAVINNKIDAGFTFTDAFLDYKDMVKVISASRIKIPYEALVANKTTVSKDDYLKFEKLLKSIKIPFSRKYYTVYKKIYIGQYKKFFEKINKI